MAHLCGWGTELYLSPTAVKVSFRLVTSDDKQSRHRGVAKQPPFITMSNPFAARRERQQDKLQKKMEELQGQSDADGGSFTVALPGGKNYDDESFDKYLPASAQSDQAPVQWQSRPTDYSGYEAPAPPSRARLCMYKLQSSFMVGFSLGGAVGFLYGSWMAIQHKHVLYVPIALCSGCSAVSDCRGVIHRRRARPRARDARAARATAAEADEVRGRRAPAAALGAGEVLACTSSAVVEACCSPVERRRGLVVDAILKA